MVRRATPMPSSFKSVQSFASLSGFRVFSSLTNFRIAALMAVDAMASPVSPETRLEKKYLSSNVPLGVCMYLRLVARETVDSCNSTSAAMSANIVASYQFLRFLETTVDAQQFCTTFSSVSSDFWLLKHRASCKCSFTYPRSEADPAFNIAT